VSVEIERKFLVASEGWRGAAGRGRVLRQFYLAETDRAAVRVRIEDDSRAWLTIKAAKAGLSRDEFEYPVPVPDARRLVLLAVSAVIEKTRFDVPHDGRSWEIDVYAGENAGLVIAEIELASETEALALPPWIGPEVTGDARYYAARLAFRPFRLWQNADRADRPDGVAV
jgi:CYTH domain-containing protein